LVIGQLEGVFGGNTAVLLRQQGAEIELGTRGSTLIRSSERAPGRGSIPREQQHHAKLKACRGLPALIRVPGLCHI
jgi:hypothetical protein